MNLYFRLLRVLLASLRKPRVKPTEVINTWFRVWPGDIDLLGHMNNGRYLQVMDVARIDWMRRARILDSIIKNRWGALLGGTLIRYSASLSLGQKYCVQTRVISWDERWFFLEHRCVSKSGDVVAIATTRAGLRNKAGWVHTDAIIADVVPGLRSQNHPLQIKAWLQADDELSGAGAFEHLW